MRLTRIGGYGSVALMTTAAFVIPAAEASPSPERGGSPKVKVGDDFYSPSKLDLKSGADVKFKWLSGNENKHNVTLTKGPSGIDKKQYTSKTDKTGVNFSPSFKKSGNYDFLCTIHPEDMRLKVDVKK